MEIFLKSVAGYVNRQYGSELGKICIVFPNRRAGLFFNKYLAEFTGQPVWAPQIRTISDLMSEFSGLQLADPLTLIFLLYRVYNNERKSNETFDEFYYWGEMLLNDFDDLDKYLVDARQLFQNITDLKDIERQFSLPEEQLQIIREFWSHIRLDEQSRLKDDFKSIWEKLFSVYTAFKELLLSRQLAYEGMMNREVISKIEKDGLAVTDYEKYVIVGFNALNACEKKLFKYLQHEKRADFFWDYDDYYVNMPWHEAGFFIRENLQEFPQPPVKMNHQNLTRGKNIEVLSVPSAVGQAKMIPDILNRWGGVTSDKTRTAIILADEQMLVPVLSSIPPGAGKVNVTLGYPFKFTPVYSFFEAMVGLQHNVRKQANNQLWFYHRDVTILLDHPYVQSICPDEACALSAFIRQYNRVFIPENELQTHSFLKHIFRICRSSDDFLKYLTELGGITINYLKDKPLEGVDFSFDRDYWFTLFTALNRLQDILQADKIETELPTLVKIMRKLMHGLSISFRGEPLSGLQVMGVLETRVVDFDRVIVLSVNEGNLPGKEAAASFIPYNLRRGFGLPTIEHQDAVYAYYFYRLLQRAENVALMYNSQSDNGVGEKSRFLYQMSYDPAFILKEQSLAFRVSVAGEKEIFIRKTEDIMEALNRYTSMQGSDRYLTPTALNAYLDCSLRFYFRYVAGLREKEEVTEDIEGSMFGKLLHYAMEQVYQQSLGKTLQPVDIETLRNDREFIESCIMQAFSAEYYKKPGQRAEIFGKSLVVKEVLHKYMLRILQIDAKLAPLTLHGFEKSFLSQVGVDGNGKSISVNVGGKIDRIDYTGHTFRVIDYKTGLVRYGFQDIEQLFDPEVKQRNKEAMQVLLYAFLLSSDTAYSQSPITSGIYGLRDIFSENFDYRLYMGRKEVVGDYRSVHQPFMDGLKRLLSDIFNTEIPFTKVSDRKKCEYCDYKLICHR